LPDGEIAAGTPIPALVPIPTIAMALMPTAAVPGYPFFVPAQAGHRPPNPPLDTVDDGGLPRHIIIGGTAVHHKEKLPQFSLEKARLDFDKSLETAQAKPVPENRHDDRNRRDEFPRGAQASELYAGKHTGGFHHQRAAESRGRAARRSV
jgi:hypothetical protein